MIEDSEILEGRISTGGLVVGGRVGQRGAQGIQGIQGETGATGATGNGISSIAKTSASGLVDTYTITFTNGNTTTFNVTNGQDGTNGTNGSDGAPGTGIADISKTSSSGLVDTYTITYDDGNTETFNVTNGKDGTDGVDGTNGTNGTDGYSPTITSSKSGKTTTLTITDKNGTSTATILDGEDADGMVVLTYDSSTWNDFITAYNANRVVYCRVSGRMAFMAYVNNGTNPTEVEFQYYRSVATHTDAQQGDQVFVYKLTSSGTWTTTTREAYTKVVAGTGLSSSYSSGTITLTASGKEDTSNKVTSLSSSSTDTQYPSAKCVYDLFNSITDGDGVSY